MDVFPSFVMVSQPLLMSTRINCTDCGEIWIVHGQEEIHHAGNNKEIRSKELDLDDREIFRDISSRLTLLSMNFTRMQISTHNVE